MRRMIRRAAVGIATVLVVGGTIAAPAQAGFTWSDNGGKVVASGRTITLYDTGNDGRFVTTEYRFNNGSSSAGLANKNGYGTSVSATQSTDITNAKICRSQAFPLPVDCGRWAR